MARPKKALASTNDQGQFLCPKCNRPMIPMSSGKGWRCSAAGKFNGSSWSGCDGVQWNNAKRYVRKEIDRLPTYPTIPNLTDEQIAIQAHHSTDPKKRGSRLTIHNSGPGGGKTSTIAAVILKALHTRLKSLTNYHLAAFNRNAADNLLAETPGLVSVYTLNGLFGHLQGYRYTQYDDKKLKTLFFDAIKPLPKDEKPMLGNLMAWCSRMRDLLLFNDHDEPGFWTTAIAAASIRFPGLAQQIGPAQWETINYYVPYLLTRGHMISTKIDLDEQYCRPALDAIKKTGWKMPLNLIEKNATWEDSDIAHLANLIKEISLPNCSLIVDEAQDLSLSQLVAVLACTYRSGELTLVGDDYQENPYKAGQAIFGWRGAFPGSLTFISRLWEHLTHEKPIELGLNLSQRCPPEVVAFVQPANTVLRSAKKKGTGKVYNVSEQQAFTYWINADDNARGLWITRKNAPLAPVFLSTIKARKKCQLRGNGEMTGKISNCLYNCAGWFNQATEEFQVSLSAAMKKLRENLAEEVGEDGKANQDSIESFILEIGEAILADPSILLEAELTNQAQTVGNLRRFLCYFVDHAANRVLSTVYRSKGDQADYVIVADVESLNSDWNGDKNEAAAVRHVACTRSAGVLLTIGNVADMDYSVCSPMSDEPITHELIKPRPVVAADRPKAVSKRIDPPLNRPAVPYLPPAPVAPDDDLPNPDDDVDYLDDEIRPGRPSW